LLEHIRQGLRAIDPSKGVKILEFEEGLGSDIANVEQLAIRDCGGVAGLSNSINAVADRQDLEALYDTLGAFLGR
jgi:hypothetical protein